MSTIMNHGYFESGPGAWCSTRIRVYGTPDVSQPPIYELSLNLPPAFKAGVVYWLFAFALENVVNHESGLTSGDNGGTGWIEREKVLNEKRYWLEYSYDEAKAPPFACAGGFTKNELDALVNDGPGLTLREDVAIDWEADGSPPIDQWSPSFEDARLLVDPTRNGQ